MLVRAEAAPSVHSAPRCEACARYQAMRNSPEYAALVKEIAGKRGEVLAGQPAATAH